MSDIEDNNLEEVTNIEPFDDPAVQEIASTSKHIGVDDYNPFKKPVQYNQTDAEPAVIQPTVDPLQPLLSYAELLHRQEELDRKEAELQRKEEEMMNYKYNRRRNNWPPLPTQCCFEPCFYQDFDIDIPLEFQKIVRNLYYLWQFHTIIMILNIICGILMLNFKIIAFGILLTILHTPLSYLCWFRPAYKAFRSDSSFNFMLFFLIFFFQFVVTSVQAIGIPGSGTIGLIFAVEQFDGTLKGTMLGSFALLIAMGFCCAAAADFYLITKIRRIYRSTGASFAKAQAEFATEFLKNPHVVKATADAVVVALQSQFNLNIQQ